jgi:hypothetical protein
MHLVCVGAEAQTMKRSATGRPDIYGDDLTQHCLRGLQAVGFCSVRLIENVVPTCH